MPEQNKLVKLTDSDLYCIELPKDAESIDITDATVLVFWTDEKEEYSHVSLPLENWQILGTMKSETDLSFDPAPYLINKRVCIEDGKYKILFLDYRFQHGTHSGAFFETPLESLTSLLSLNGIDCNNSFTKLFLIKSH